MDTRKHVWASALLTLVVLAGAGCENGGGSTPSGTLRFLANGEDFARLGFTSKDGWQITFEHAYVCVSGPTAFQMVEESAKHAGHSHVGIATGLAHETLTGEYVVDLTKGTEATELGAIPGVAIGNYNRMDWNMVKASGDAVLVSQGMDSDLEHALGHCVVLMGTAQKGATTITFTLKFGEEMFYMSTEANVDSGTGKSVGIAADGGTGVAEMTFHFDHIFGDESTLGEPDIGMRFDYYSPAVVGYTLFDQDLHELMPGALVATDDGAHRWLGALYFTWWQSPFVKFRLQYEHEDGSGTGDPADRFVFQCVFAAGPHKHERY
jgi:hypothetical protein